MSVELIAAICLAFGLGLVVGLVVGAWGAWARYLRSEPPRVRITLTPELVGKLSRAAVEQWLDERGLIWMPKGKDFKPEVKRER